MLTCINEECETIHMSDNLKKCTVCGQPFDDYGISPHNDFDSKCHK